MIKTDRQRVLSRFAIVFIDYGEKAWNDAVLQPKKCIWEDQKV